MANIAQNQTPQVIDLDITINNCWLSQLFPIKTAEEFDTDRQLMMLRAQPQDKYDFDKATMQSKEVYSQEILDFHAKELKQKQLDNLKASAQGLAKSMLYKALFSELVKTIDENLATTNKNEDPNTFIVVDTANNLEPNKNKNEFGKAGYTWAAKIGMAKGSYYIYKDIYNLMLKQSNKIGANLDELAKKMTLLVPASHMPYLVAPTNLNCSALAMLNASFPELKTEVTPALTTGSKQLAVLICDDKGIFGKAGYFVLQRAVGKLSLADDTKAYDPHIITIPAHCLKITNPEQIAVLREI